MQETFNSKRQVETGVKYISSIGPLTGAGGVSPPSLSSTVMRSSAEYKRAARVSERETERREDAGIRAFRALHTDY